MICGLVAAGGKENQLRWCRRQCASPSCLPDTRVCCLLSSSRSYSLQKHRQVVFLTQWEALALQGKEDDRVVALACYAYVLLDSKLRVRLAGMHKSHSRESTAGKKDGWTVHSLLIIVTFPLSPAETSLLSSTVLLGRRSKKRRETIVFQSGKVLHCASLYDFQN